MGQAECEFLGNQPGGGSITFTVTLTDKDVRGGDQSISSLEVVVTPESLAERESSVLWHRLFSQVEIVKGFRTYPGAKVEPASLVEICLVL